MSSSYKPKSTELPDFTAFMQRAKETPLDKSLYKGDRPGESLALSCTEHPQDIPGQRQLQRLPIAKHRPPRVLQANRPEFFRNTMNAPTPDQFPSRPPIAAINSPHVPPGIPLPILGLANQNLAECASACTPTTLDLQIQYHRRSLPPKPIPPLRTAPSWQMVGL